MEPRIIKFYETTLRDGEQTPGVNYFPEEKLARQAIVKGWSKRTASDVITYYTLKETLTHPPEV